MKCLNYHPKYGYGWDYPNTRNNGDPYDCYTIMYKDAAIAVQHDGVRYAFPAIYTEKEMMEYSHKHSHVFGLKPETIPLASKCPICRGDMANTDGSLLRCLSCGYEQAMTVEGPAPDPCPFCKGPTHWLTGRERVIEALVGQTKTSQCDKCGINITQVLPTKPKPVVKKKTTVEGRVCSRIQARAAAGLNKYGVTMERTDLTRLDWLQHAQDEALDLAVYLEKLKGMET